jgi:hypothetical protein
MRLMACSLRVDTVSELRWNQFERCETPEGDKWICKVEAKDSTDREAETRPRSVFIPNDLMEDLQKYINGSVGDDERLFKCTTRTIQRDVTRSASNAATRTGDDEFEKISAHDLRRYFATHLLFRHETSPPVVRMLGGWKSDEAMFEYLVLPNDVLFERLGDAGLLGTSYDKLGRHDTTAKIEAATDRLADLVTAAEQEDVTIAGKLTQDVFADIEAITVDIEADASSENSSADDQKQQTSFEQFNGHHEVNGPIAATAKWYWRTTDRVIEWTGSKLKSMWDRYVGVDFRAEVRKSKARTGLFLATTTATALMMLMYGLLQVGVYIDPIAGDIHATPFGVYSLIVSLLVYLHWSGNMWETALADLGYDSLADRLTIDNRLTNSAGSE